MDVLNGLDKSLASGRRNINKVETTNLNVASDVLTAQHAVQRVAAVWPTRQSGWRAVRIHISFRL